MTLAIHRKSWRPILPDEAARMRAARDAGATMAEIAADFDRSAGTISKVLAGKRSAAAASSTRAARAPRPSAPQRRSLPHITAAEGTPDWYRQQDEAFAAAWYAAFGDEAEASSY